MSKEKPQKQVKLVKNHLKNFLTHLYLFLLLPNAFQFYLLCPTQKVSTITKNPLR